VVVDLGSVLPPVAAEYGDEVQFARGSRLNYPHFTLAFEGILLRGQYKTWRFSVITEDDADEVFAFSGGVRGATQFTVGDREFLLDLQSIEQKASWTLTVREA
jgi:hypothetical protein